MSELRLIYQFWVFYSFSSSFIMPFVLDRPTILIDYITVWCSGAY